MARPRGSVWTEQEEQQLLELKKQHMTNAEIAEKIGRSPSGVKSKLERLHHSIVRPEYWTEEEEKRLIELRKIGLSYQDIADQTNRSKWAIKDRCSRLGLTIAKASLTHRDLEKIHELYDKGVSARQISKQLKRSPKVVSRTIKEYQAAKESVEARKNEMPRVYKTEARMPSAQELLTISDGRLSEDVRAAYQQVLTQASTVEMVLYTLYKTPKQLRPLSIEDAAVKLVRLVGKGPEYFHARREWRISDWLKHLVTINEEELP